MSSSGSPLVASVTVPEIELAKAGDVKARKLSAGANQRQEHRAELDGFRRTTSSSPALHLSSPYPKTPPDPEALTWSMRNGTHGALALQWVERPIPANSCLSNQGQHGPRNQGHHFEDYGGYVYERSCVPP